jgi:hypothetical protein
MIGTCHGILRKLHLQVEAAHLRHEYVQNETNSVSQVLAAKTPPGGKYRSPESLGLDQTAPCLARLRTVVHDPDQLR